MLRHPVLHKLTEDHHAGLVQARYLKVVEAPKVHGRIRSFMAAWRSKILPHFLEEEGVLLPSVCPPMPTDDPAILTALQEHIQIRRLVADLAEAQYDGDPDRCVAAARAVGERLEAHTRGEEQILFERIQEALDDDALEALGVRLRAWEGGVASIVVREEEAADDEL